MGLIQFKHTFCEFVTITKTKGSRKNVQEFITKYHNVEYLYSLISHYVYEADLELMIKQNYIELNYSLTPDENEKYKEIKDYFLNEDKMQEMNNNLFLQMTQSLQHSYCLAENKLIILDKLLSKVDLSKTIIFCKYTKSNDYLSEKYKDTQLTILTYGKHSFGLNMQEKNVIIYFDKTFDYAQRLQSEYRIFRTGQTENCTYYDLSGSAKLENLINENISNKISMIERFKAVSKKQIENIL
jgi:SNF2 family DNA or RNA helicase